MKRVLKSLVIIFLTAYGWADSFAQSDTKTLEVIDSIMSVNYPKEKPGAAVIVMKDHKLLFKSAYGVANLETAMPNSTETIFRIGSVTKQFTAICVMKMLSENKLSLDEPLAKYYPAYFADKKGITIRHLLSHTSGIKDLSRIADIRQLMSVESKPDDLINIISLEEVDFEPGEKFNYSNSGYVILGGILEQVSGLRYKDLLQELIFSPLKMDNTFYINANEIRGDHASGYFTRSESFANAPDINSTLLYSAGGLWSTIEDMAKWNEALYTDTIVDSKFIDLAFAPNQLNSSKFTDYGFGFRNCVVNGVKSIEHGGGVFGYSTYGIRIESEGVYVMILTNFERNNNYDELAATIAAIAIDKPYDIDMKEIGIPYHTMSQISGTYLREDGDTLRVSISNEKLILTRTGRKELHLKALGPNSFLISESLDDRINFQPGNNPALVWKPRRSMAMEAVKIK